MNVRTGLVLLLTGLLIVPLTLSVFAMPSYTLTAEPSIDTPERTVTYAGNELTLNSVTRTTTDETVEITAGAPDETSYNLQFRDPDNTIIEVTSVRTGDSTYTIDSYGTGEAGSYAVSLRSGGDLKAVHPLVIPGYTLDVTAPDSVSRDDSITVTAAVTERSVEKHSALDYLQVVVYNDDQVIRQEMSQSGDGTYEQTLSASEFDGSSYDVSVVVRGDAEVRGQEEILAFSDPAPLTVTDPSTPTATTTDDNGGGAVGGGGGAGSDPVTTTTQMTDSPPNTTATATPEPTTTETTETPPQPTSTETTRPPTPTDDGILEPGTRSPAPTTTGGSGPGFTSVVAVIAIFATVSLLRRN